MIAADLSRKKELDADSKAIQQIKLVGELKILDADGIATDAGHDQSMFALTILDKITETRSKFCEGSATVL